MWINRYWIVLLRVYKACLYQVFEVWDRVWEDTTKEPRFEEKGGRYEYSITRDGKRKPVSPGVQQ